MYTSAYASPPPLHPTLRESILKRILEKVAGRISIAETEHEEYLRVGCKFAGRCPKVMEVCKKQAPDTFIVDGVKVKCHLYAGTEGVKEEVS